MPIPNHCVECDKPLTNDDGYLCESCQKKEKVVYSSSTGVDLADILPSVKEQKKSRN